MKGFGLATLMVLVGCSSSGRPDISASEDTVCDEVAEVACYNLFLCCTEGEIESFLGVDEPRSEDECRHDVQLACERNLSAMRWSLDNARVTFDAARLNQCLEALLAPEGACAVVDTTAPWADACTDSAWVGAVTAGNDCFYGYECAAGNFCAADRKCRALPTQDELCAPVGCANGFFCDQGTCEALVGNGGQCNSSFQCQDGLFCDFDAGPPACAPERVIGETCMRNDECDTNTCVPGTCATNGNFCYRDTDCSGQCMGSTAICFGPTDCQGTCSITMTSCFNDFNCGDGETCINPECVRDCIGDPFCAENYLVYDYCDDALTQLPD